MEKSVIQVDENLVKNKKYAKYGDILIAGVSNKKGTVGKSIAYMGKEKCLVGNEIDVLEHKQNPKYLSYLLSTKKIREKFEEISSGGAVFNIYTKDIKKIDVPIYSLESQNKIVQFLDKFMKVEEELKKELENRRKQYEYYKNLIFERGINELNWELKTLEEINLEMISGEGITRSQLETGDFPAIKCGDINSSLPQQFHNCISFVDDKLIKIKKYFEFGDVLMSKLSNKKSTIGKSTVYLNNNKGLAGNDVQIIKTNNQINHKYLNYALSTKFSRNQIENFAQEGTVFHLYPKNIKQIKIPLPNPEEQAKVVEILDKLYAITNDIKEGIPALIQKNRDQYNFYKESLIFPE